LIVLPLAAIGASYVLVTNHRAWAVAPLLILDLSIANYWVPALHMSLRLFVTLASTAGALTVLARAWPILSRDGAFRWVLVPTGLFIVADTVVNLLFSEIGFVVKYLRYQIVLVLTLIVTAGLVRDRRSTQIVAVVTLVTGVISALAAIGQRIGGPFAHYATVTGEPIVGFGTRALGLSGSPVTLANNLTIVLVPVLGFLAVTWSDRLPKRSLLMLASAVLLGGIYVTTTRSGLIAVGVGVVTIAALVDQRRRFAMLGVILAIAILAGTAIGAGLLDQRFLEGSEEDNSAASHLAIGQVALAVALDNWLLGIGRENFEQVSRAYESAISLGGDSRARQAGEGAVGSLRPHNDFLEVWSSWGIFGLLTYLAVFVATFRNFMLARRSPDPLRRGLAIGGAAGLVAYAVGSFFHNYLDSSVILWIYAGLSASLATAPDAASIRLRELRGRLKSLRLTARPRTPYLRPGTVAGPAWGAHA
jgi:O-antigen ligase